MSLLIGWHLVLRSSQHLSFCVNSTLFQLKKMNKCIRMGITASNLSFGEVNRRFYGRKLRFTAPLTRRRKTKFPTVKPPIYLPKWQIWMQLSPKCLKLPISRTTFHGLEHVLTIEVWLCSSILSTNIKCTSRKTSCKSPSQYAVHEVPLRGS